MPPNKHVQRLLKRDNAVKWGEYNPYSTVLRTGSPSFDFIYGKAHGLPFGYSEVLWGPPKGGKSIATYVKIGQLHQADPEALVVKYNTEGREELQLTPQAARTFGIDLDRYMVFSTNLPDEIFDHIANDIKAEIQAGAKIRYIIIDSVTNILGRRTLNAESVMQQQIGDDAKTLQDGLKMIQNVIRNNKIALTLVAQARAELDPVEQMRGNKLKMAGAWALQHFAEFFILVEPNKSKAGKTDLAGNLYENASKTDVMGHADKTAHKIRVTMKGNSTGLAGRVGEFTLDYYNGIINTNEEAFLLGTGQGVVLRPNNTSYVVPNFPKDGESATYRGKDNFVAALRDNSDLKEEILRRVRAIDTDAMISGKAPVMGVVESSADAAENQLADQPSIE